MISIDLLPPKHTQAKFEACDLSSEQAINQLAGVLPDRLAGLICVAGVGPEAASPEQIMRINFLGLRHLVLQLMDRLQTSAGIVTVASSAGRDWAENQTAVAGVLGTEDSSRVFSGWRRIPGIGAPTPINFLNSVPQRSPILPPSKRRPTARALIALTPALPKHRCQQASDECSARRSMMTSFGKVAEPVSPKTLLGLRCFWQALMPLGSMALK